MEPDWEKGDGLLPAVVQDADTHRILMLGYMNDESLKVTQETGHVTFWSRSKDRLWTKGETSGHFLELVDIILDCDQDTFLVTANPRGPVCHTGTRTCFGETPTDPLLFLNTLGSVIRDRKENGAPDSYTAKLFAEGSARIAQKVGEEGLEVALAHATGSSEDVLGEAADLLYHLIVLLEDTGADLSAVCEVLRSRHAK